jgi:TonB family protein
MPDAARIAQAQALEVSIVLRGAKTTDDAEKPELFTETARTVLVFDNGLVLHLHSKLTVGQTVSIHNTQNGREVLCKVLEAPAEGELGLTDLEFTTAAPDFWDTNSAAETEQPKSHVPSGVPSEDPLAMMLETSAKIDVPSMRKPGTGSGGSLQEELMPAHEMAPDPSAVVAPVPDFEPAVTTDSPMSAAEPTGEQIDAALKQMSGAAAPLPGADALAHTAAEADPAQEEKHIAALMERDARLAKFAAFKEKQAEKIQKDAATKSAGKGSGSEGAEVASELEVASEPRPFKAKAGLAELLTTGKNATYVAIAAGVLITVAIFFVWHAMRSAFVPDKELPAASAPLVAPPPASAVVSTPVPPTPATAAPVASAANADPAPVKPSRAVAHTARSSGDEGDAAPRKHRGEQTNGEAIESAVVLSQPQPTLPPWAVGMQLDGVVRLDVVVDEKGNVSDTRVLSGPRALQREAERAIGLWVFEPARSDGKAIPSHLILSVEFLPPPPPKRIY